MGSLVSWRDAGVTFKVEVTTSTQLILAGKTWDLAPLLPGGPSGIPNGWVGNGIYSSSTIANSVAAGIYTMQNSGASIPSSLAGAEYTVGPIDPTKTYLAVVDSRGLASKMNFRRTIRVSEYNPTTDTANSLTQYSDAGGSGGAPADWETIGLTVDGSAFNVAGGFTHLRIGLLGVRDVADTPFGGQWSRPYIQQRSPSMPAQTWRDITCDVQSMTVRYGRERFTERFDVATLQLQLLNTDGEYSYANPHPFNFGPGRIVRVTATIGATTYAVAYHIIDQCVDGMDHEGHAVTNVTCLDPTTLMSNRPTPNLPGSNLLAGARIGLILDFIGYGPRTLQTGVWTMQRIAASGRSLRDEMGVTADSEAGYLWAERNGQIVYRQRGYESGDSLRTVVQANLYAKPRPGDMPVDGWPTIPTAPTICLNTVTTDWGMSRVINRLELANAGSTSRVYDNEASQEQHGIRTYQRTDFVLTSDALLDTRAADYLTGYTQPMLRLNQVSFRPGHHAGTEEFEHALKMGILYLVRVWYQNVITGWGWSIVTRIQGWEHRITATEWDTTYTLDQPVLFAQAPITETFYWDNATATWDHAIWS